MKHLKLIFTSLICACVLCGCASKDVIVTVNDRDITKAEFNKQYKKRVESPELKHSGIDLNKAENIPLKLLTQKQVIDEMIVLALIDEEIEKRKIEITDADVEKEYNRFIQIVGSEDKLKEDLKKNGVSEKQFKDDLKTELKYRALINQIAVVNVSDNDAKKFYQQNIKDFKLPERVRASHILISANDEELKSLAKKEFEDAKIEEITPEMIAQKVRTMKQEQFKKAQTILAEVKKDITKFEQIAREKSDDKVSAKQGGDLGEFAYNQMVEPFSKAAFSLRPASVSEIVESPYGYHIIYVKDKMAAGVEPFEKAKANIKAFLEMSQRNYMVTQFVENIKKTAKIDFKENAYNPAKIAEEIAKFAKTQSQGKPLAEQKK